LIEEIGAVGRTIHLPWAVFAASKKLNGIQPYDPNNQEMEIA
jgi:hypothetical protein